MRRLLARFARLCLVLSTLCAGACGSTTALGIHWGCNPDVPVCDVSGKEIDALARAASALAQSPDGAWRKNWVIVNFEEHVIQQGGEELCGATTETDIEVMYAPVFAPESALLHELYHEALYLKRGDYDSKHLLPGWQRIELIKAQLRGN